MKKQFILFLLPIFVFAHHLNAQDYLRFDQQAINEIISAFADPDPFASGIAIDQIVQIGSEAAPYLINSIFDQNEAIRTGSAIALYKILPPASLVVPVLIRALQDSSADVRWTCTLALSRYEKDARAAVPALQTLLSDSDPDIRWAAYIALLKIDKTALQLEHDQRDILYEVDTLTPALMTEYQVPGVAITLIRDHKIVASRYFGVADAADGTKVDRLTVFEVCSMSKPVFAFLALDLIDQGKLSLDQPLSEILPETFIAEHAEYAAEITARMVLSHTSGLPNWRKSGEERDSPLPVYFKPGTKFNYSGEGIFYLQRVVEKITGLSLPEYAGKTLFDRLGFSATGFVWSEQIGQTLAAGHDEQGTPKKRMRYNTANAAYTLYSTSEEYARFILEVMNTVDLHRQEGRTVFGQEMATHQVRVETRETINRPGKNLGLQGYRGLGWAIDSTISGDILYHSGSNQTGFRCYSQFDLESGSGLVILTNGDNGNKLWPALIEKIGDI